MLKLLQEEIKVLFPKHTEIELIDQNTHKAIKIEWLLGDDPNRPNKKSRNIIIHLTREFEEDYNEGTENIKDSMFKTAIETIKIKLIDFEPNHENSINVGPPSTHIYI